MAIIKAMTSGGVRRELDFYPTPPEATRALLPLISHWPRDIWEPCCGNGAISEVLLKSGFFVDSFDIADHGYGERQDFFATTDGWLPTLITNPPFGRADDFIRHAHKLGVKRMALLLKINFWSAKKRMSLFSMWRPYLIAPLTWRLDFTGAGAPHTDCMWCLWDRSQAPVTFFEPLQKPVQDNIVPEAA